MTHAEIRSDVQVVRGAFIHGTSVVIGETAIAGDHAAFDHGKILAGAGKGAYDYMIGGHATIGRDGKGFV